MHQILKGLVLACGVMGGFGPLSAQTNPTAVNLPFTLNSQSTATLPAGVSLHRFSAIPVTRTLAPANSNLAAQGSSSTANSGGWYYLGTDGIGLLASTTNPAGALVVAINTTGLNNINVSWICKTIYNQASRDNSVALQYRVGTSGNFTDVSSSTVYTSNGKTNGHSSATLTEVLPVAAENQPVVQLRWIYWESNISSGSRDKIAIDDILVHSISTTCMVPAVTSGTITDSSAGFSWTSTPSATSYEYAVTATPAAPSSGINTTDTAVTATGLNAGNIYYFHVRSNCGSGNFSGWTTDTVVTTGSNPEFTVMSYNLLNYPGSTAAAREPLYRTIMNGAQPDIIVVQELSNASGISSFLNNVLNYSGATYSAGTFVDGPDSDNGIYYKTALFQFISNTPISTALRDISQFKLKQLSSGDTLILYSAHLKASNTPADEAQRTVETQNLRAVTNALDSGKYFLVCGDFNIYGSAEGAYQELVQNGSNAHGKFNDILSLTGSWNNPAYAAYHTQSPRTTSFGGGANGGMDDRFDMFLFSDAIVQNGGFDIVPNSYKAFGNDGQHYNQAINTPPYLMYDSVVAAALHGASDHLPVVVKLKHTPARGLIAKAFQPEQVIDGATIENFFSVYPNPAHNLLFLKIKQDFTAPVSLYLYDINGRLQNKIQLNGKAAGTVIPLDISMLQGGIYYLRVPALSGVYKFARY